MAGELSPKVLDYLKRCGLPAGKTAKCNPGTRMFHDLGLYGDIAEAFIEVLADDYHVDLAGFEFEKFFAPEFSGKTMLSSPLISIVPFAGSL